MPDISMCQNNTCPSRISCYRFMAMPIPHRQAYMAFEHDWQGCEYYLPLNNEQARMVRLAREFEREVCAKKCADT